MQSTTKYAVPDQIKLRMLELSIRRSQSSFRIVYIFLLAAKKKNCYRDFSIGQVGFGNRSILRAQPAYAMTSSKSRDFFYFLVRRYHKKLNDWPQGKQ